MNNHNRVIIISHVFLPSIHANAKQPFLIAKYLAMNGWKVKVFTSSFAIPDGVQELLPADMVEIVRIPNSVSTAVGRLRRWSRVHQKIEAWQHGVIWPDIWLFWVRRIAKIVQREQYDRVILCVLPYSSLLFSKYGVMDNRWVLNYQEMVCPHLARHPRRSPLHRIMQSRLLVAEKMTLHQAGCAWFTCEEARKIYIEEGLVAAEKTCYFPHFYDPDLYCEKGQLETTKQSLTILYGGNFDQAGHRSPVVFFNALARVAQSHPDTRDKIRVSIYGYVASRYMALIKELGIDQMVHVYESIPFRQFLKQAQQADVLLFVDAKSQRGFAPGKIADYIGAARPVLALTQKDSTVHHILQDAGLADFICAPDHVDEVENHLENLWLRWIKNEFVFNLNSTELFSARTVVSHMSDQLEKRI